MAVSQNRIDVIKGVRRKIRDDTTKQYKFGPLIPFSANAAAIYFPKQEGQLEDHTLQEKITEIEDDIVNRFTNIIPDEAPSPISTDTSSIGTTPAEGMSEKYARQDHQHFLQVSTGTGDGEIKIGDKSVKVNGWANFQGPTISSEESGSSMGVHGLVPAPTPAESEFYLKGNGTWSLPTTYGTMNGATEAAAGAAGLVPVPTIGDQVKFLRGDGIWAVPTNTTYADYKGATASTAGVAGLVPAAASGNQELFLRGDATWQKPTDTTYATFTGSAGKLVPTPTTKQATTDYVLTGAGWQFGTKYNTDTNTTYNNFTSAAAGLVPIAKSGSTNMATSAYVLTGAGWKAGTQYNTDTTYSFNNNNPTLDWGKTFTIGTVGGTALTVKMPGNPNTDTTYGNMRGAKSTAIGAAGLVPAPERGQQDLFLRGDAKWAAPTNTTYGLATNSANGLLRALSNNTNQYLRGDGSWQTPPNTTYGLATNSSSGLLKALSNNTNQYLRGDGSWQTPMSVTWGYATMTSAATGGGCIWAKIKHSSVNVSYVNIAFDFNMASTYQVNNYPNLFTGLPKPYITSTGVNFVTRGQSETLGQGGSSHGDLGCLAISTNGELRPHSCGKVWGHWYGSFSYMAKE